MSHSIFVTRYGTYLLVILALFSMTASNPRDVLTNMFIDLA